MVYPGTSGAAFTDYIVSDAIVAPPEHVKYYSEKFVMMPHSYQVNYYTSQVVHRADAHHARILAGHIAASVDSSRPRSAHLPPHVSRSEDELSTFAGACVSVSS